MSMAFPGKSLLDPANSTIDEDRRVGAESLMFGRPRRRQKESSWPGFHEWKGETWLTAGESGSFDSPLDADLDARR